MRISTLIPGAAFSALSFALLVGCASQRAEGTGPLKLDVAVDTSSFPRMNSHDALIYLANAAVAYEAYPAPSAENAVVGEYSEMCRYAEAGIFDPNVGVPVPFSEWLQRAVSITSSLADDANMTMVYVHSRTMLYGPTGSRFEHSCVAYRRKSDVGSQELQRELGYVATALAYLGVEIE